MNHALMNHALKDHVLKGAANRPAARKPHPYSPAKRGFSASAPNSRALQGVVFFLAFVLPARADAPHHEPDTGGGQWS